MILALRSRGPHRVRGLDVAVHDLLLVRVGERLAHLRRARGATPLGAIAPAAHDLLQRVAVDVLHRDVVDAVLLAGVVDRHDVRVVELRGALGLAQEVLQRLRILLQRVGQHLERDDAVEHGVLGLVDDAHAAAAELAEDLVAARLGGARGAPPRPAPAAAASRACSRQRARARRGAPRRPRSGSRRRGSSRRARRASREVAVGLVARWRGCSRRARVAAIELALADRLAQLRDRDRVLLAVRGRSRRAAPTRRAKSACPAATCWSAVIASSSRPFSRCSLAGAQVLAGLLEQLGLARVVARLARSTRRPRRSARSARSRAAARARSPREPVHLGGLRAVARALVAAAPRSA